NWQIWLANLVVVQGAGGFYYWAFSGAASAATHSASKVASWPAPHAQGQWHGKQLRICLFCIFSVHVTSYHAFSFLF
ncbi:MAG: hypothetical protein RSD82_03680, partial [Comamonas sp.]